LQEEDRKKALEDLSRLISLLLAQNELICLIFSFLAKKKRFYDPRIAPYLIHYLAYYSQKELPAELRLPINPEFWSNENRPFRIILQKLLLEAPIAPNNTIYFGEKNWRKDPKIISADLSRKLLARFKSHWRTIKKMVP